MPEFVTPEAGMGRRSSQIAVPAKSPEGAAGEGMYIIPFRTMVSTGFSGTVMSWEVTMWAEELAEEPCWLQVAWLEAAHWAVRASSRECPAIFPPGWIQKLVR